MKLTLLTTLSLGALLPLVATGGEGAVHTVQESVTALTLVPAQDVPAPKLSKPVVAVAPLAAATPATPAIPATPATPAAVAIPQAPQFPWTSTPSGLRRLRTATTRSTAPQSFARTPRTVRSRAQQGLLSQQGTRVSVSSGNGLVFYGPNESHGSTTLLTAEPGSRGQVLRISTDENGKNFFSVGAEGDGLIRIVTSTCCEGSDCCESDESDCNEGRTLILKSNGQLLLDGDEDSDRLRYFLSSSGDRDDWQDEWEELHEEQLEMMEDTFEEWEEAFGEQMDAFGDSFDEMEGPAWEEMETHLEAFESKWDDARDEWQDNWEDQWEGWEQEFENAWIERADGQYLQADDAWIDAAAHLGTAAELHGVQSEEFNQGLSEFMDEYQVLIRELHEEKIPALLSDGKRAIYVGSDGDCDKSKRKRQERAEREQKEREHHIHRAQEEAERSVMEMHRAQERAQRELNEAQARMAEHALHLQEQAARAADERAVVQERELHEHNQQLHNLHRRNAELKERERQVRQEAKEKHRHSAPERVVREERARERSIHRDHGTAPHAESGEALGQLQELVSDMQSSIESLRSDLRDLRERVDALSKREFH